MRGAECGFSSIDNHKQYAYSKIFPEVLGLVIEINEEGQKVEHHFFEMSKIGRRAISCCSRQANCTTREQHDSCGGKENYQIADHKVLFDDFYSINVSNFIASNNVSDIVSEVPMQTEDSFEHESIETKQDEDNRMKGLTECKHCLKSISTSKVIMHLERSRKGCKKAYGNQYHELKAQRDKERKEYQRNYKEKNKKRGREKNREYRKSHAKAIKENNSQYRKTHAEAIKQTNKQYRKTHPEAIKETNKQYRKTHVEAIKKTNEQYRRTHAQERKVLFITIRIYIKFS